MTDTRDCNTCGLFQAEYDGDYGEIFCGNYCQVTLSSDVVPACQYYITVEDYSKEIDEWIEQQREEDENKKEN